jgi:hypothetical protein
MLAVVVRSSRRVIIGFLDLLMLNLKGVLYCVKQECDTLLQSARRVQNVCN